MVKNIIFSPLFSFNAPGHIKIMVTRHKIYNVMNCTDVPKKPKEG